MFRFLRRPDVEHDGNEIEIFATHVHVPGGGNMGVTKGYGHYDKISAKKEFNALYSKMRVLLSGRIGTDR